MYNKNELIRRYRLENGIKMTDKFDQRDFESWLNSFNRYNIFISKLMKKKELLTTEKVIEVCSSDRFNIVSKSILSNDKRYVLCHSGFESIKNKSIKGDGYLIANGYYNNIRPVLLEDLDRSFTVGVVGRNNSYNNRVADYYRILKEELISLGVDGIREFTISDQDDIVYLISHVGEDKQIIRRLNKPVIQTVSER